MPKKRCEGVGKDQTTSKPGKAGKPTILQKDASVLETKVLFPIVGIGASAGGLDAFEKFFTNLPPDTGMAFVLVQHLDPTHKSILSELIKRYTSMKVVEVEDGMLVEPNSVFVIPPNWYMAILHGKLHLLEPTAFPGHRTPIDYFFRTLAEDVQKLLHELHVHQIELEMQNDELRRAQLALEESRDRYLDLYDYAPVGCFTLDKNALVLEANLSGEGLMGMEKDRLMNKPLTRFGHKDSQDTFYFHLNLALQTGTRHVCQIKLVKPDGSCFHAELESVRIADSDGEHSRLRIAISDITDRTPRRVGPTPQHDAIRSSLDRYRPDRAIAETLRG